MLPKYLVLSTTAQSDLVGIKMILSDFQNWDPTTTSCLRVRGKNKRNLILATKTKRTKIWLLEAATKSTAARAVMWAETKHTLKKWGRSFFRESVISVHSKSGTRIWKTRIVMSLLRLSSVWALEKILARNCLSKKRKRRSVQAWVISKNGKRKNLLRKRRRRSRQSRRNLNKRPRVAWMNKSWLKNRRKRLSLNF